MGAKGVGESPNVGSPAAFVNAVIDASTALPYVTTFSSVADVAGFARLSRLVRVRAS